MVNCLLSVAELLIAESSQLIGKKSFSLFNPACNGAVSPAKAGYKKIAYFLTKCEFIFPRTIGHLIFHEAIKLKV